MSYFHSSCQNTFTIGQFERMNYYLYEYKTSRSDQLNASYTMNFYDFVEFQDTEDLVKNVKIRLDHPNDERYSIMTTGINGLLQANHFKQQTTAEREKLGSNSDFSYSQADWNNGVFTSDIVRIRQHILNINLLDDSFSNYAFDSQGNASSVRLVLSPDFKVINKLSAQEIMVYPNPFTSEVTFDFSHINSTSGTLFIYDNLGKLISQQEVLEINHHSRLVLSNLNNISSGVCYYNFQYGSGNVSGKFVKN